MWRSTAGRAGTSAAAVLALLSGASCGDGSAIDGGRSFAGYLESIPLSVRDSNSDDLYVAMADLDRAAELAGVERPEDAGDLKASLDYFNAISGSLPNDGDSPQLGALLPEIVDWRPDSWGEGGWSLTEVSWFVEVRPVPRSGRFTAMGGDFEPDRLTEAMGEPEDGIWAAGDRTFGLSESDRRLMVAEDVAVVEEALAGPDDTLAGVPELGELASALDDAGAYSAWLQVRSLQADPETESEDEMLPEPYTAFGLGLAHEEGQDTAVFVYIHADGSAAAANGPVVEDIIENSQSRFGRQPWLEWFDLDTVTVDGSVVVVRLDLTGHLARYPREVYEVLGRLRISHR